MIDYSNLNDNLPSINDYLKSNQPQLPQVQQQKPQEEDGFFKTTALKVGSDLINQGLGLGSVIADKLGNNEIRDSLIQQSQEYGALSNRNSRDYQDITKVNSAGDLGKYLGYQGINTVANILPVLVASRFGGAGITAGAEALGNQGLIKGAINNLMVKQADKIAMGTVGGLQNLGQVNAQNIGEQGQVLQDGNAMAFGTGAVLGTLEGNQLLGKFGQVNSRIGNAGITGLTTGTIGIGQSAINRDILGKELTGQDAINEYINAGVGGFVGGAPFGLMNKGNKPNETINQIPIEEVNTKPITEINKPINDTVIDNNITTDNTTNPIIDNTNNTPIKTIKDLGNELVDTIKSPFEDSAIYITDENNNKVNTNITEDKPLLSNLIDYEQNKPVLEGLSETPIKRINDIVELVKNKDGTISEENLNLINNLIDISKNESEKHNQTKFLGQIKRSIEDKVNESNFTNEDARNLNVKIESVLPKKEVINKEQTTTNNKEVVESQSKQPEQSLIAPLKEENPFLNNKKEIIEQPIINKEVQSEIKLSSNSFKDKISNLSNEQVYKYIEDAKQVEPLSIKEKNDFNRIENEIKPIKDNVGVDIVIIPEKHSPFEGEANAWYDDKNNRIVVVGTKETKANIQGVVFHELWHKGISLSSSKKGLEYVSSQFNELYKNKLVKNYADDLISKGYDKNLAIEEAVGHLEQNNSFKDTPFLDKIYQSIKNMINKIVGKDMELSNEDVRNFFNKTVEPVFNSPKEQLMYEGNVNSIFKFSSNNDNLVENIRTNNENKTNIDNLTDYIKNLRDKNYKEGIEKTEPINKFLKETLTQNALLVRAGGEKIYNLITRQNSFKGKLEHQYSQNSIKMDNIIKQGNIKKPDLDKLNNFLGKKAYIENDGHGIRVGETEIRNELTGKVSSEKLNSLVEYAKYLRQSADDSIYINAFKESLGGLDSVMSGLRKTNRETSMKIEAIIEQTSKNVLRSDNPDVITVRNIHDKINQVLLEDSAKITPENKELLKPIMEQIQNSYDVAQSRFNNGYIPKDFRGKYVVSITDPASGKTIAVLPFEKNGQSAQMYSQLKGQFGSRFNIETYKRSEPISSNLDINKAITEFTKNGITLSPDQLKDLAQVNKIASNFDRTYKGYGYNERLANVIHDTAYKNINESSQNFLNSDKYDFINSFNKNSIERNTMQEIMKQMQENTKVSDKTVDQGLRSIRSVASTFALGLNLANSTAQIFQSSLVGISHASKYGTSLNTKVSDSINVLKNGMKSSDPMTQEVIDALKYNDLLGGSMTKQIFEDTKQLHDKNSFDKFKEFIYKPNEIIEKTLRMSTLLRSVEVYKMAQEGKLSPELNDKIKSQNVVDFVSNELATINGDFSKEMRSKVLQGEFAQTLLMFQQWKAMTYHAFSQMDGKGKGMFLAGNILAGGFLGFPFAQDFEEAFDFFAKLFGKNMPAKRFVNDAIKYVAGNSEIGNQVLRSGASNLILPGIGERVGLGSIVPSLKGVTEMVQGDTAQGFKDSFGPASNFMSNILRTTGSVASTIASGNISNVPNAVIPALPAAVKNLINGTKAGINNYNTDERGNKILNNINEFDALLMAFGLSSSNVSNQKYNQQLLQEYNKNLGDIRNSYVNKIKKETLSNDSDKGERIGKIIKEAQTLGYNIDLSNIIESQVKNKSGEDKVLNNMSLRDRMKAKKELNLK